MYTLEFSSSSMDDLDVLRKSDQRRIVDRIEQQLRYQPLEETRNRKPLRSNELAPWELRDGRIRVFYEVDEQNLLVTIFWRLDTKKGTGCSFEVRSSNYENDRSQQ